MSSDIEKTASTSPIFEKFQIFLYDFLDRNWIEIPKRWKVVVAGLIIVIAGLGLNGNWLLLLVCLHKQFAGVEPDANSFLENGFSDKIGNVSILASFREMVTGEFAQKYISELPYFILSSLLFGYILYIPLCGFLHWYFYVQRRDTPEEWKCQPRKFLKWEDEKYSVCLGTLILTTVSIFSGCFSCYIMNGGYNTLYYNVSDNGWVYYIASIPILFLLNDLLLYYAHRAMHLPYIYRHIHKIHHRFKQPNPFTATAMHPVEAFTYQFCTFIFIFTVPVHWTVFLTNVLYMFYYAIMDHSGVKLDALWPWQPSTTFHDNHHQYFHVNFGFNLDIWDKLHGTLREKTRVYNEKTFFGIGKNLEQASAQEVKEHFDNIKDD